MRQLMFVEAGRVAWDEAPDPQLTDSHGALVRPLAVARCDLDQPMAAFGIFPGPQVTAFDPSGVPLASFTGTVTLAFLNNPVGALLGNSEYYYTRVYSSHIVEYIPEDILIENVTKTLNSRTE
jgi:hypothetical protein